MAEELNISQRERDVLIRCIGDAYEALRVLPDVDPNGPALVWLASHLLEIQRHNDARAHA